MVLKRALDLRGNRTQVPLGLVECASVGAIDFALKKGWINKCMALAV